MNTTQKLTLTPDAVKRILDLSYSSDTTNHDLVIEIIKNLSPDERKKASTYIKAKSLMDVEPIPDTVNKYLEDSKLPLDFTFGLEVSEEEPEIFEYVRQAVEKMVHVLIDIPTNYRIDITKK